MVIIINQIVLYIHKRDLILFETIHYNSFTLLLFIIILKLIINVDLILVDIISIN